MADTPHQSLLDAILDSWDRSNTVLLNLLYLLPAGGLDARPTPTSHTVAELFTHMHHERMISVSEEAPEIEVKVPAKEWVHEPDVERIAQMLTESAQRVRAAVKSRTEAGRAMDLHYAHPIGLIQLLIFHEAYHHGQIKLALKLAGCAIPDSVAGGKTWGVWRARK